MWKSCMWRGCVIFFWEVAWFFVERLHDFFLIGCAIFFDKRLRDFLLLLRGCMIFGWRDFVMFLCGEVAWFSHSLTRVPDFFRGRIIFLWRGCVIFWRLGVFLCCEVAWFFLCGEIALVFVRRCCVNFLWRGCLCQKVAFFWCVAWFFVWRGSVIFH